jgi:outer membrane protein TolC
LVTSLTVVNALNPKRTLGSWVTVFAISLSLLSGCSIGPDYLRPKLPDSRSFGSGTSAQAESQGGNVDAQGMIAQRFIQGADIPSNWWMAFGSPELTRLVERALAANPNIEAAHAALRAAQENVSAQRGFFFPTVQANYAPLRLRNANSQTGNTPGSQANGLGNGSGIYNFYTAQLTVGFNPDV